MKERITYKGAPNHLFSSVKRSILRVEGEVVKETDKLIDIKNNAGYTTRVRKLDIINREVIYER